MQDLDTLNLICSYCDKDIFIPQKIFQNNECGDYLHTECFIFSSNQQFEEDPKSSKFICPKKQCNSQIYWKELFNSLSFVYNFQNEFCLFCDPIIFFQKQKKVIEILQEENQNILIFQNELFIKINCGHEYHISCVQKRKQEKNCYNNIICLYPKCNTGFKQQTVDKAIQQQEFFLNQTEKKPYLRIKECEICFEQKLNMNLQNFIQSCIVKNKNGYLSLLQYQSLTLQCQHEIHLSCLQNHVVETLKNQKFKIPCPICLQAISPEQQIQITANHPQKEYQSINTYNNPFFDKIVYTQEEIDKFRELKLKQCKQCNRFIQRSQGCNHMTCKCGFHFCYVCEENWLKSCHNNC